MLKSKRNDFLDVMRGIAAISVVLYHYLYRGWINSDFTTESFGEYDGVFKYGYLGVQFFFIISGYMISVSILNKKPYSFLKSRALRLYPAYWICLTITIMFMALFGMEGVELNFYDALLNYTMVSKLIGIPFVDGAYWTLIYELVFYFWFFIGMCYFKSSMKELFLILSLVASVGVYVCGYELIPVVFGGAFIPYFFAGMCLCSLSKKIEWKTYFYLLIAISLSVWQVYDQAVDKATNGNITLNPLYSVIIVVCMYILFWLVSKGYFDKFRFSGASLIAVLSYPVYLIHQNVGYILINELHGAYNSLFILFLTIAVILLVSLFVGKYAEPFIYNVLKIVIERLEKIYAIVIK